VNVAVDAAFIDQLKKLTLLSRRRVASIYAGSKKSVIQGRGIEVIDHREYFPGDDPRNVDWNIYGRTEKLYIKRFEEEKNLVLHVLLDSSASMNYGSEDRTKFDYAGSLAAGFTYLTVGENAKFSLALYADSLRDILQPGKGKTHFFKAVDLINNAKLSGETDLSDCMGRYVSLVKSKSFVVLVSDFLEPIETLTEGIIRIAKVSKELILVMVLDPVEVNMPYTDDILFEDMEGGNTERTYVSPNYRKEYEETLKNHVSAISETADDIGADFFSVTSDKPIFETFISIVNREIENARLI